MPANTVEQYLAIVHRHFSQVAAEHVERIEEGWQYANFLVDGRSVCRFSPSNDDQATLRREAMFLQSFAPASPLPLPEMECYVDAQTGVSYAVYDYIPGAAFTTDFAAELTPNERLTVAQGLGAFLGTLHSFPLERARSLGVGELDPRNYGEYFLDYLPAYKSRVFGYLSPAEQRWITQLFVDFAALAKRQPFQTCVTHSDIRSEHIIVAPKERPLPAIIDFGGVRIADPANDFAIFNLYGDEFSEEAYRHYGRQRDEQFDARRRFYAGLRFVYELERWVRLCNVEKIALHHRRLSDYIAANPHR